MSLPPSAIKRIWIVAIASCAIVLVGYLLAQKDSPGQILQGRTCAQNYDQTKQTATSEYQAWEGSEPITSNSQWQPKTTSVDGMDRVLVPPGRFIMGSADPNISELPVSEQCITKSFWLDKTEVTNDKYPSPVTACNPYKDYHPTVCVTWFQAFQYCKEHGGRLPTEVEWEYAARGPDNLIYPWGNMFVADNVVYDGNNNGAEVAALVGSKPTGASWVGALDLSGNVWEWVSTQYKPYPYDPNDGREDLLDSDHARVIRGGSWANDPLVVSGVNRYSKQPSFEAYFIGFRCAYDS